MTDPDTMSTLLGSWAGAGPERKAEKGRERQRKAEQVAVACDSVLSLALPPRLLHVGCHLAWHWNQHVRNILPKRQKQPGKRQLPKEKEHTEIKKRGSYKARHVLRKVRARGPRGEGERGVALVGVRGVWRNLRLGRRRETDREREREREQRKTEQQRERERERGGFVRWQ